jgi:hypothetical protein
MLEVMRLSATAHMAYMTKELYPTGGPNDTYVRSALPQAPSHAASGTHASHGWQGLKRGCAYEAQDRAGKAQAGGLGG